MKRSTLVMKRWRCPYAEGQGGSECLNYHKNSRKDEGRGLNFIKKALGKGFAIFRTHASERNRSSMQRPKERKGSQSLPHQASRASYVDSSLLS